MICTYSKSNYCVAQVNVNHPLILRISDVFLHRDKRRNISTANWTGLFSLDELFAAVLADAEMAAWHYEGVLRVTETDEALGIWVVIFNCLMTIGGVVILSHSVNGFQLEWKPIDLH